jgi:hypothetical protein
MRALAFGVLFVVAGCASQADGPRPPLASQSLLSALGMATALQHESDVHEARGQIDLAIESARRILDVPFPDGAAEREDVRLDAYGRIAELEIGRGDLETAQTQASQGLSESTRDSYFRARLHVVLGRVHELHAAHLRDTGDEPGARTEAEAAIDELEQSITINRTVLGIPAPVGETP